jgi:hypothetical protein
MAAPDRRGLQFCDGGVMLRFVVWLFFVLPFKILFLPIRLFILAPLKLFLLVVLPAAALGYLLLGANSVP